MPCLPPLLKFFAMPLDVTISLMVCIFLTALSIGFFGFSYVYWTETTGTGDDQRTDSYYDKENYFNNVVPLFGAGNLNTLSTRPLRSCPRAFCVKVDF